MEKIVAGNNQSTAVITRYITALFNHFDEAGLRYCIERNYENYPDQITGDIDIVVEQKTIARAMKVCLEISSDMGLKYYLTYKSSYAAFMGFYLPQQYPNRFALTIELFPGGMWKGISYLDPASILHRRIRHGITWKPAPTDEAIIRLMHHLLYNRKVFKKYHKNIKSMSSINPEEFQNELGKIVGTSFSNETYKMIQSEDWDGVERQATKTKMKLLQHVYVPRLFEQTVRIFNASLDIRKKTNGIVIIVRSSKKEITRDICESIVNVAIKWHIYMPPQRKIFYHWQSNEIISIADRNQYKKIVSSGGVLVLGIEKSVSAEPLNIFSHLIFEMDDKGEHLRCTNLHASDAELIPINDNYDSCSHSMWDVILKEMSTRRLNSKSKWQ